MQSITPSVLARVGIASATVGVSHYVSMTMRYSNYTSQSYVQFPSSYSFRSTYNKNIVQSVNTRDISLQYSPLLTQNCTHFISPSAIRHGWFSSWFCGSKNETSTSTTSDTNKMQKENVQRTNDTSLPTKTGEKAIKPSRSDLGLSKRLRLLYFTKLMRKAMNRVKQSQEREVEDAVNETKRILKDLRAKLHAIRLRVQKAQKMFMKRFMPSKSPPKLQTGTQQAK